MCGFISFCSIGLHVCLCARTILFLLLYSFVICFEVRKYDTSSFIVLFKFQGPLSFHVNFRIVFAMTRVILKELEM